MGRDKILRTLQYFSRFYCWYLDCANRSHSAIHPFEVIEKQFEMTRRILRIGKFIEKFDAASAVLMKKSPVDPVLRYLTVIGHLGYGSYLALDTLTVMDAIGVRKLAATKRLQNLAYRAWMVGLTCNAMASISSLWKLQQKGKSANREEGERAIEATKIHRYLSRQYNIIYIHQADHFVFKGTLSHMCSAVRDPMRFNNTHFQVGIRQHQRWSCWYDRYN